jgi:hypothetical protein
VLRCFKSFVGGNNTNPQIEVTHKLGQEWTATLEIGNPQCTVTFVGKNERDVQQVINKLQNAYAGGATGERAA